MNALPQSQRDPAPRIKCLIVDDLGDNLLAVFDPFRGAFVSAR